ncbi:hypothetical protein AWZ03_014671, partial [Drosophila navojoa]
ISKGIADTGEDDDDDIEDNNSINLRVEPDDNVGWKK